MLATLADAPLADPNLVYEPKYDGIRALIAVTPAGKKTADVTISSRVGNDKTAQFPELVHALARWGARRRAAALLDGEIVALDATGQPAGFQRIQDRIHLTDAREIVQRAAANPIAFVAFDLLRDGDEDLCPLPLVDRRRRLEAALSSPAPRYWRRRAPAAGKGWSSRTRARRTAPDGDRANGASSSSGSATPS